MCKCLRLRGGSTCSTLLSITLAISSFVSYEESLECLFLLWNACMCIHPANERFALYPASAKSRTEKPKALKTETPKSNALCVYKKSKKETKSPSNPKAPCYLHLAFKPTMRFGFGIDPHLPTPTVYQLLLRAISDSYISTLRRNNFYMSRLNDDSSGTPSAYPLPAPCPPNKRQ